VQRRFLPFVREVMNRHALDSGIVVIVAHSATLGFMVPMLATNVPSDFALRHPLPNTGIIKTELRDSRLLCTDWAGVASFDE
jgi:2,3-bisphosphoglycerate-dependent phosphoglycerate mutase